MIYRNLHRIIEEIEKKRNKGQIIHFLTGDGINDNLFYGVREGILTISDSLKKYYIEDNDEFDFFIHAVNSNNNLTCYEKRGGKVVGIHFEDMFPASRVDSPLGGGRRRTNDESINSAANETRERADDVNSRIVRLDELLKQGKKRVLIFWENLEWIANLYGDQPDHTWMSAMQKWQKSKNLLMISTIKDMEPLQRYHFDQEETFISNPSAEEIKYAYLRYLLKNAPRDYRFGMAELDDIAHGMSVGKKTLCACMRILRSVLKKNPIELRVEDFDKSIEKMIAEKVSWEKVRLEDSTKQLIKTAVENFMRDDEKNPPRKGLILTGPPGTGKTLIAKALANETKCYFMSPTLADLKAEYVGQSSAKIKRVFAEARGNAPTILFIDEADTVFPSRSLGIGDRDSFSMDMVNQFLQELDGAQTGEQKIFTIAATNRPEAIDSAIKSRLSNEPIEIPLPSKEMRRLIFEDNLSHGGDPFSLNGKIFEDKVLTKSENMSGRDIMNFVKTLKETATQRGLKLGNDSDTEALFDAVFRMKEDYFIVEAMNLGIFSKGNIIKPGKNEMRLNAIIGYDELKEKIALQAEYIRADQYRKKQYDDFGIKPQKGVLLYGPPGNGKSVLAEAIAGEYGFYFFKVLSRDFATINPEQQIKNLERIFTETARFSKMTDCPGIVLFFDEFDSLVGTNVLNTVVRGSLLNYIADKNGLRNRDSKILFIAATNFYSLLDEAVKRQGRIDTHLLMDNPTPENGRMMLKSFFDKDARVESVSSSIVEEAYEKLFEEKSNRQGRPSGAEIETLYKELKEIAFHRKSAEARKLIIDADIVSRRFPA